MGNTKTTIATIVLALILTITALLVTMPSANAESVEVDSYVRIMLAPNPVGIGQQVLVTFQLDKVSPSAMGIEGGEHFTGFTVTITYPDGTTETKGPYEAAAMSGNYFLFVPDQVGTYTFQASFPGQRISGFGFGGPFDNYYKPSTSGIIELTVQEDPIQGYPDTLMSQDEYWERPIYGENKGWWQGADNWLMQSYDKALRSFTHTTAFAPYTAAPNSAHILWKKPIIFGGIGGGKFGDDTYYTGLSYEQFYLPLILEGRIYYLETDPATGAPFGTRVLNLYTGEEIFFLNNTSIDLIQIYDIENPNEHGLIAHLWDASGQSSNTTVRIYDAFTGRQTFTITNITWGGFIGFQGGPTVFGPSGEILSYRLDTAHSRLILWNSSKAIHTAFPWMGSEIGQIYSPTVGAVVDGRLGIQYNVSIPNVTPGTSITTVDEGYILAQSRDTSTYPYIYTDRAYDTETGQQLWVKNRTELYATYDIRSINIGEGVYVQHDEAEMVFYGYDIKTGNMLWKTTPEPTGWGQFTYQWHIAYGKFYTTGYEGYIRAYDIENGQLVWEYYVGSAGYETPYGSWPSYNGFTIADGKIYVGADEHSPNSVLWRGGKLWAVDVETGNNVWNISGMFRNPAIADGILTALNSYDGQVYTFGNGPSATTVTASPKVIANGDTVIIEGTVTDQSVGQPDTPCVSKESMSAWMEYLHMQKQLPMDATGVPVKLEAFGADGSYIDIGTVTSDLNGFRYAWTPPDEGLYTILATFYGDDSYGSSYAGTGLSVGPAPTPYPEAPSAEEVAQKTIDKLPPYPEAPSAEDVAQETISQLPPYPEPAEIPEVPAYLTIDLAIIVAVAVAIIVGLYSIVRKQK